MCVFCFLVVALEEQKANLSREFNSLKHTHNKVRCCLVCVGYCKCLPIKIQFFLSAVSTVTPRAARQEKRMGERNTVQVTQTTLRHLEITYPVIKSVLIWLVIQVLQKSSHISLRRYQWCHVFAGIMATADTQMFFLLKVKRKPPSLKRWIQKNIFALIHSLYIKICIFTNPSPLYPSMNQKMAES